ncbi:MAG TPA: hypothetical protein VKV03_14465 [Candidatus Binataceae bacterium]|nr:hypothetical protein [Candidatus Binataceae bacterium]
MVNGLIVLLLLISVRAGIAMAAPVDVRDASIPSGFAAPDRTEFAPILKLAAPGSHRAERAMGALDRQLVLQRLALHPEYSPTLKRLFDQIPPRNSTLIRAAAMYPRGDIPWTNIDGTHELCAEGYPSDGKFYVTTLPSCAMPEQPLRLGAYFALKPPPGIARTSSSMESVIGTFGGQLRTDTFGFGALVDTAAQMLTEFYGDLAPPWDSAPGTYNHHDEASRARFRRDLPNLDDKLHQYLRYENVLDEFDAPSGPYVLFNFSAEVRADALKKFPDLYKFYEDIGPALIAETDFVDEKNNYWMRNGFDRGKVWMTFMVRDGKLSAFDAAYHPVGEPIALGALRHGVNRTHTSIRIRRLGMDFGLDNLSFTNYFSRDDTTVSFQAHMDAVPDVIAPAGIRQGAEFIAGEFMRTIAEGSGGMHSEVASKALGDGTIRFTSEASAEFMYSPALEFFASLGDSIADEHDAKVREQERMLSQEFLDAFVKDYNNARPRILALDQDPALMK